MAAPALTVADRQACAAVKALWDAEPTLGGVAGELKTGRLKSPQVQPYAMATSEKGQDAAWMSPAADGSSPYFDYRTLRITCRGTQAQMEALGNAMEAKLALLPKDSRTLDHWPESVQFVRILQLSSPAILQDETTKDGKDIWMCVAEYEVWTTRRVP